MSRRTRWFPYTMAALLTLSLSDCSTAAKEGAPQVSRWFADAKVFLSQADAAPRARGIELGGNKAVSSADDLLHRMPNAPTAEEATLATRLRAIAAFDQTVANTVSITNTRLDTALSGVAADALVVTPASASPSLQTEITRHLTEHGKALLKDTACELTWSLMTTPEHDTVKTLVADNKWEPTNSNEVPGISEMAKEAATSTLTSAAQGAYLKLFTRADLVDWSFYSKGLYDKASKLIGDGAEPISHPDGTLTKAFIYYARVCLSPPKS